MAYSIAVDHPAVQRSIVDLIEHYTTCPQEPRAFLEGFLAIMGLSVGLPNRLPAQMEHATRLLMRARPPFGARIRLDDLASARIPTLVVSGGHSEVFEAICDRLAERLAGERDAIPGAQHAVPSMAEAFNERLEAFLTASGSRRAPLARTTGSG